MQWSRLSLLQLRPRFLTQKRIIYNRPRAVFSTSITGLVARTAICHIATPRVLKSLPPVDSLPFVPSTSPSTAISIRTVPPYRSRKVTWNHGLTHPTTAHSLPGPRRGKGKGTQYNNREKAKIEHHTHCRRNLAQDRLRYKQLQRREAVRRRCVAPQKCLVRHHNMRSVGDSRSVPTTHPPTQ
jgi:hypothetical protein